MQDRDAVWLVALEPPTEELGEEMVVAEPLSFVVDLPQEQVAALDLLQARVAVGYPRERRREGPADASGDRGGHQEGAQLRVQGVEDVFGQEFGDDLVAAGEAADHLGGVVAFA